jgi:tetratricopeptide (TPR) repeat protein
MEVRDAAGLVVTAATPESLSHFEAACHSFRCYTGDPVSSVNSALELSPAMPMAHALKAWLHLVGTDPSGLPVAQECIRAAKKLVMDDRERGHLRAIELASTGHWREAGRVLEDVAAHDPTDALALQAGHLIDFLVGDSRMLRDRIARALPAWSPSLPGYHAVLGMYAFGLEETGDYGQAEKFGRRCVELEPRDGWGWHSVAHVMEMQNRYEEGIAWMRGDVPSWSENSFFAVHNWWHLALFHLEQGDTEEVLRLFDGPIYGARSMVAFDLLDATALLWRLHLLGVDVGDRWSIVAGQWEAVGPVGDYAFNAYHTMMAYVGADRVRLQNETLNTLKAAGLGTGDAALFAKEIGLDAAQAILAFGAGRYSETLDLLRPLRHYSHRFGGSHAQRDLIDLTMIEAAIRSGRSAFASALVAERAARRPHSPAVKRLASRVRPVSAKH